MKAELNEQEIRATNDAIARFKSNDPALKKTYDVEFVIVDPNTLLELNSIESFLGENEIEFRNVRRYKSDILVEVQMKLEEKQLLEIESYLTYFANEHGLKYDGWGAFE